MLFSSDEQITAQLMDSPDFMRRVLRQASDSQLINDYVFLESVSKSLFSCDDYIYPFEGIYIDDLINVFERYLEYLSYEIVFRFIKRYEHSHPDFKEVKGNEKK